MKIRRTMVVLFTMAIFIIPVSLYRIKFAADASAELSGTVDIIFDVLIGIFLLLTFAFSIFTDDFPHSYNESQSRILGLVTILLAAAIGYASVLNLISDEHAIFPGTSGKVLSVIGILSVLAFMFYAVTYLKGENVITSAALIPIFPSIWYGCRLLVCFLESAAMADISSQLIIIAMCGSFTIFSLTLGKLFSCTNSHSVKWAFTTGCIGVLCSFMHFANWMTNDFSGINSVISNPLISVDLLMAFFAIGVLFHISAPAKYFDDEEWDDYFYETYDLPKPNLVLHTPVDELQEDSLMDDDIDEPPYIPATSSIGSRNSSPQPQPAVTQPTVPSYIANPPASYQPIPQPVPQPAVTYPTYPTYPTAPPPAYYPTYPSPAYPPYPYPPMPSAPVQGYEYYPTQSAEPYDPYDAAAAQYQYERRRAELQNRELEMLTGEVDNSLARLENNVTRNQNTVNEYVAVSPDEKIGGRSNPAPNGRNVHLASGAMQPGERLTDHLDQMEREARERNRSTYDESDDYDDYTYEYYYPTDGRSHYPSGRFAPKQPNNNQNNPNDRRR